MNWRIFNITSVIISLTILASVSLASADAEFLATEYRKIQAQAIGFAGQPLDIPRRVEKLFELYQDSKGNHVFPLVALHGASWAKGFFNKTGPLGQAISYRYFYSSQERKRRLRMLEEFAEGFQEANRQVFIDTYTNYHFTKIYGEERGAKEIVKPELLHALNVVHQAVRQQKSLSRVERKQVYQVSLIWEQEATVAPRIEEALTRLNCPILKAMALKPVVHFRYMPPTKFFVFSNFSSKEERIEKAIEAYDIAEGVGWEKVESSKDEYGF